MAGVVVGDTRKSDAVRFDFLPIISWSVHSVRGLHMETKTLAKCTEGGRLICSVPQSIQDRWLHHIGTTMLGT